MLKSLKTTKFVSIVILSLLLCACEAPKVSRQVDANTISLRSAPLSSQQYLARAESANQTQARERQLLLAAHAMLNEGHASAAMKLLASISASLSSMPEIQAEYRYLMARALSMQSQFEEALISLHYPANWALANWQRVNYYQLRSQLYQARHQPIEAVRELSHLSQYLPQPQANKLNDTIWRSLQPLSADSLAHFMQDAKDPLFAAWVELAYLVKRYAVDPNQLITHLSRWQSEHPSHPATLKLPTDLENALNTQPYRPQQIAVLLPLTGSSASLADPVKQGIMASYLAANNHGVSMDFFDTAQDPQAAYQAAVSAGADFIIGPLLPKAVEAVQALAAAREDEMIPQLFLNTLQQSGSNKDLFYFALSPSDEAKETANKLFDQGIERPLLLVSDDRVGRNMADSFSQTWSQLTGQAAEMHFYDAGDKMKVTVQDALGVTDSKQRIAALTRLLNIPLKADFRSRRDIDAIYMISASHDLALLKPFIDVNFSVFTQPVPLYASSRSHIKASGEAQTELDRLTISDIPWLIRADPKTAFVSQLWPNWSNSNKRLYSMGYDALDLISQLAQMRALPGYQIKGLSGVLSVTEQGQVNRLLSWGRYRRGHLTPL